MAKSDLLAAVIADVRQHGFADRSLRDIAAAVDSSHRMLIYHFGSRDGLLEAVVTELAERSRRRDVELFPLDGTDGLRARWERTRTATNRDAERLFFELALHAVRQNDGMERFRGDYVEPWLRMSEDAISGLNVDRSLARALTRLDVAVIRGLMLDRLVTDEDEVDAAFEVYATIRRDAIDAYLSSTATDNDPDPQ